MPRPPRRVVLEIAIRRLGLFATKRAVSASPPSGGNPLRGRTNRLDALHPPLLLLLLLVMMVSVLASASAVRCTLRPANGPTASLWRPDALRASPSRSGAAPKRQARLHAFSQDAFGPTGADAAAGPIVNVRGKHSLTAERMEVIRDLDVFAREQASDSSFSVFLSAATRAHSHRSAYTYRTSTLEVSFSPAHRSRIRPVDVIVLVDEWALTQSLILQHACFSPAATTVVEDHR